MKYGKFDESRNGMDDMSYDEAMRRMGRMAEGAKAGQTPHANTAVQEDYVPFAADGRTPLPPKEGLRTEIVFILDASGSMHHLTDDTIGGFNALLDKNREEPGEATVTTVLFNHEARIIHDRIDIRQVPYLTRKEYCCDGCTALLDAVGDAIERTDLVQKVQPAGYKADKVLFAITTDGMENASRRFSYKQVKRLIEQHREQGWEFLFIGANIDAAAEAANLGIAPECAAGYVADDAGTDMLYCAMSEAVANVRAARPVTAGAWKATLDEDVKMRGGKK